MAPTYSDDEFEHWFLPREGVINTYVVENSQSEITDFASFYSLPSTVVNHKQYKTLFDRVVNLTLKFSFFLARNIK